MTNSKSLVRSALILWFLLIQTFSVPKFSEGCIASERTALLSIKEGFEDPANRLKTWRGEDCCAWKGVVCSNKTSHVITLDLRNTNLDVHGLPDFEHALSGKLSSSLLALGHLNNLDLSMNDFNYDQIPKFMGSMSNLRYLNFSGSYFGGSIPPQLGNLSNLLYLDLKSERPYYYYIKSHYYDIKVSQKQIHTNDLSWLSRLSLLKYLDMSYVNISTISNWPQIITMLSSLQHLYLSYSMLQKPTFTHSHSNLSNLENLDISSNFYGDVMNLASLNWILNSTSLISLYIRNNNMTGITPRSFNKLCNIKELHLSNNPINMDITEFTHGLPRCIWSKLQLLELVYTKLVGNLSSILHNLPGLENLYLGDNNLTGTIPYLIRANKLTILDLGQNYLDGIVSKEHFVNLTSLQILLLYGNSLTVDQNWIPPITLIFVGLDSCILGPKFPSWIKRLTNITYLSISNTSIIDEVPIWFWNFSYNLMYLDMSNNQLSGKLHGVLQLSSLQVLFLVNNRFEGPIPELPQNLTILNLSNNSLLGTFPKKMRALNLSELILSKNSLNGSIPTYICQMYLLRFVDLSSNLLTGPVPKCWTDLDPNPPENFNLEVLQLRNNSLSNSFPSFLEKCQLLYLLDLSYNKFSGNLPSWIGKNHSNLKFLLLGSNMFSGNIPIELTMLHNLEYLDLSHNSFSGTIPPSVNTLRALIKSPKGINLEYASFTYILYHGIMLYHTHFTSLDVVTKGITLEYNDNDMIMPGIDLSSNSLTGEIPESISSLEGLINLNLSGNQLNGNIPWRIGDMQALESLDLSNNDLSGGIPSSLSNLTWLSYLNMSNNNLSGRIPAGNQLQTLDNPSIYSGNNDLCGPPLSKNCPGDENPISQQNGSGEVDRSSTMSLYLGICIGFISGLWFVFCLFLFKKSYRVAYFRVFDYLYDMMYVLVLLTWARIFRK